MYQIFDGGVYTLLEISFTIQCYRNLHVNDSSENVIFDCN